LGFGTMQFGRYFTTVCREICWMWLPVDWTVRCDTWLACDHYVYCYENLKILYSEIFHHFWRYCGERIINAGKVLNVRECCENLKILYSEIFHHFWRYCGERIINAGKALNVREVRENKEIQLLHFALGTTEVIN